MAIGIENVEHLAYQLWENDGRPHGRDQEYYFTAERLLAGNNGAVATAEAPKRRTRAAAVSDKPKATRTRAKKQA
ncbi:MAG: DUF2934 domain-containing protein [Dehalococcoidia bacterium]